MRIRPLASVSIALAVGLVVMVASPAWASDTWSRMTTQDPGTEWDMLTGVTAVSSTNVWAVGEYVNLGGNGAVVGLIEHYDGSNWSVNHTSTADLESVKATSASNIWAVGFDGAGAAILHYNGTKWSRQQSPTEANGFLYGVVGSSASDAWAVGQLQVGGSKTQMLIEHWNGTSWKVINLHNPGTVVNELWGVSSTSPTNVWAVGDYGDSINNTKALILHYDGTHWFRFKGRNPGTCGAEPYSVSATSDTDVWAAGLYCRSGVQTGLVLHYDGTSWKATGFTNAAELAGVKAASTSSVWAVGQATDDAAFAVHWNGSTWTRQTTPGSPSGSDLLGSVAAASSSIAFAVGESFYNAQKIRTYALKCCT
jgi:hypothetical protein